MAVLGTAAELRGRLRRRVGRGADTALVTDDLLNDALREALREVNKFWPTIAVASFLTILDQQIYTPLPAGGRRIRRVFWGSDGGGSCDPLGTGGFLGEGATLFAGLAYETYEQGISYAPSPSAFLMFQRNEAYLQRAYSRGGGYVTGLNEIRLDPVPTLNGTAVYFTYEGNRYATVDLVSDEIPELASGFLEYARWYANNTLAVGQGATTDVKGPNVSVHTDAAKNHLAQAAEAWGKWESNLPPPLAGWL